MALAFAGIVPHPPFLLPGLSEKKEAIALEATRVALKGLTEDLYLAKPDTLLMISQHGTIDSQTFSINVSQTFEATFTSFGDLKTQATFFSDPEMATLLKEGAYRDDLAVRLIHEPSLDYGCAIPLLFLSQPNPNIRVVPIFPSLAPFVDHRHFGKNLFESISAAHQRIGVLASVDLSHHLTEDAPGGFDQSAVELVQTLLEHLESQQFSNIFSLDEKKTDAVMECAIRPLIILLGLIEHLPCQPKLLSYEAPSGVGYAVMEFLHFE